MTGLFVFLILVGLAVLSIAARVIIGAVNNNNRVKEAVRDKEDAEELFDIARDALSAISGQPDSAQLLALNALDEIRATQRSQRKELI